MSTQHSAARPRPADLLKQAKESDQTSIHLEPADNQDCEVHSITQTFHVQSEMLPTALKEKGRKPEKESPLVINLRDKAELPVRILMLWIYNRIDITNLLLLELMIYKREHVEEEVIDTLMQTAILAEDEWGMHRLAEHALYAAEQALLVLDPDNTTGDFLPLVLENAFHKKALHTPYGRLRGCLLDALHGPWKRSRFMTSSALATTIKDRPVLAAEMQLRTFPLPAITRYVVASCKHAGCLSAGWDWAIGVAPPVPLDVSHPHCILCGSEEVKLQLREFDERLCEKWKAMRWLDVERKGQGLKCECSGNDTLFVSMLRRMEHERLFCVYCGCGQEPLS